jgi:hypothetical protein
MDAFARQLYAIQEVVAWSFPVSRFRVVPALTAAQVFATPVTNPGRKVKPSCALAGKSLPHGFPTTQAASINGDLLDFLNAGTWDPGRRNILRAQGG